MIFQMYRDKDGSWRWNLVTAGGQVLAECPFSYRNKEDCRASIQLIKNCRLARVHEINPPVPTTVDAGQLVSSGINI